MALTPEQISQVINTLTTASLDPAIIIEIQTMLDMYGHGNPQQTEEPYDKIKSFCSSYIDALKQLGKGVTQPNYENEMMLVYMDREDVSNVLDLVPVNGYVAAVMGVYDNASSQKQLTVSLLATDSNFEFIQNNQGGPANGEQCWKNFDTVGNFNTVFK